MSLRSSVSKMDETNRTKTSAGSGFSKSKRFKPFKPSQQWNNSVALKDKKPTDKIVSGEKKVAKAILMPS